MPYEIVEQLCTGCGVCSPVCPVGAISDGEYYFVIDPEVCCDCTGFSQIALCVKHCPVEGAIIKNEIE